MSDMTELDVIKDPEGAVLAIRRATIDREAAERKLSDFENIFAAFDHLRRSGYAPSEFSPQWRARAEKAEESLVAVRALLAEPSDERGITWWEWIDGGLGGDLHERLRAILEPESRADS